MVGSFAMTMVAWALLPALFLGWSPSVVLSGSMAPLIRPGDVILVGSSSESAAPGDIITFDDGSGGLVSHRLIEEVDEGYRTKGDANPVADSAIVPRDRVVGVGQLLVPYVGVGRLLGWTWWLIVLGAAAVGGVADRLGAGRVALAMAVPLASVGLVGSAAQWLATTSNSGSSIAAIDPLPPSSISATCAGGDIDVQISWTASTTPGVTGYTIYHDGPITAAADVGSVVPGTTTFTHTLPATAASIGSHTYFVRAELGTWESVRSDADGVLVIDVLGVGLVCN